MRWLWTLAALVTALVVVPARTARACTCIRPISVVREFERADTLFSGRVSSVRNAPEWPGYLDVTFEVTQVWQGDATGTIQVRTAGSGSMCGYEFALEQDYLVYATRRPEDGVLVTSLCRLNKPLAEAGADMAVFQAYPLLKSASAIDLVTRGWLIVAAVAVVLWLGVRLTARLRRQ